jgi:hypothetical protein
LQKISTSEAQKQLAALGIKTKTAAGDFRPIESVLTDLKPKLAGMTEAARANALQAIFPDAQARIGAQTLLSQLDFVKSAIDTNRTSSGAAADAYVSMSQTFNSQTALLKNAVGATLANIGVQVLPTLTTAFGSFTSFLSSGAVQSGMQAFAQALSTGIGGAIAWLTTSGIPLLVAGWQNLQAVFAAIQPVIGIVRDSFLTFVQALQGDWVSSSGILPLHAAIGELGLFISGTLIPAIQSVASFLLANWQPVLVGVATALTAVVVPAFVAWAAAAGAAAVATIAALAPVLAPIAAIGVAAGLLYAAWNTNFFGIRDTLTAVWTNTLQPAFVTMQTWLATNLPVALQALSGFWTGTLLPAITAVWTFLSTYVIPLFAALVNVEIAALKLAITALAGIWQNVLYPALQAVGNFISTTVSPVLTSLAGVFTAHVSPAVQSATGLFSGFSGVMGSIGGLVSGAIGWLNSLADRLNSLTLPDWMQRHSPAPIEQTLMGMNNQLGAITGTQLPRFASALQGQAPGDFHDTLLSVLDVTTALAKTFVDWATFMGDPFAAAMTKASGPIDKLHSKVNDLADAIQHAIDRMEVLARLKPGSLPSATSGAGGSGGASSGPPPGSGAPWAQPGSGPRPSDPGQDSRAHGGNQPGAQPGPSDPGQQSRGAPASDRSITVTINNPRDSDDVRRGLKAVGL